MPKPQTDRDGKSKTSSAVDAAHYPEQNEVNQGEPVPSIEEIARRAHERWVKKGRPEGSAEQDWLQAEQELKVRNSAEPNSQTVRQGSGSVQR